MQNANDGDSIARSSKIDDVLLDVPTTVTRSNCGAVLGLQRRFGQAGAGRFNEVSIMKRLG